MKIRSVKVYPPRKNKRWHRKLRHWLPWRREFDIQEAIDALPDNPGKKGLVWADEKTYTRSVKITKPPAVDLIGAGYGTELKCTGADWLIEVPTNYDEWQKSGRICNFRLTGTADNLGGIHGIDTYKLKLEDIIASGFSNAPAIQMENLSHWAEAYILNNINIREGCLKGVAFKKTNGTESQAYGSMRDVKIALDLENAVGIEIPTDCHVLRGWWMGITMWLNKDSQIGMYIDGQFSAILDLTIENQNATAKVASGIKLGPNAYAEGLRLFGYETVAGQGYDIARPIDNPYDRKISCVFNQKTLTRAMWEFYSRAFMQAKAASGVEADELWQLKDYNENKIFNWNVDSKVYDLLLNASLAIFSDEWVTKTMTINEDLGDFRTWVAGKGLIMKQPDGSAHGRIKLDNDRCPEIEEVT